MCNGFVRVGGNFDFGVFVLMYEYVVVVGIGVVVKRVRVWLVGVWWFVEIVDFCV